MARKRGCLVAAAVVGVILAGLAIWVGPVLVSATRAGLLDTATAERFTPGREANLQALRNALLLYHDSEGAFPQVKGWMGAIEPRLQRNGVNREQAQAKLVRPDLVGTGGHGYALNAAVAGKYRDDVRPPDAVLVFESDETARDASDIPRLSPNRWGITLSGKIVKSGANPAP